jgi:hypothetical protein
MTMDLKDKRNSHLENQEVKADMSHLWRIQLLIMLVSNLDRKCLLFIRRWVKEQKSRKEKIVAVTLMK